jgi:sugar lactone lactonase YvrE
MHGIACSRRAAIASVILSLALFSQARLQVGYAVLTATSGTWLPVASALFSYTNPAGVLVSQAGVGAAEPITSGMIFVDESGPRTGIALVNPSQSDASVNLTLRDGSGREVDRKAETVGAGRHLSRYVGQLFGAIPADFTGSLTFASDQKLAAITLRESRNAQGEPLYTTLPVFDPSVPPATEPLVFAHIAVGNGYETQIILMNPTSQVLCGRIQLTGSDGYPLPVRMKGVISSQFSYEIEPNGSYRADLDNPSGSSAGYALVTPDAGNILPAGTALFRFERGGSVVTEAGVAAAPPTTSARIFVDNAATYTGVALANPADYSTVVTFNLLDRYGDLESTTTRTIAPRGHLAVFAHQLFPELSDSYTGLMDIASSSAISPVTLKLTDNSRGDQVLTTLPVADLTRIPAAAFVVFPQIAIGEGFSTRLILINTDKVKSAAGVLSFHQSDGSAMSIPLGSRTDSRFSYEVSEGGGKQLLPGNTDKAASIAIVDPATNLRTREFAVNEGNTVALRLVVLDTAGNPRDDFDLSYSSLSTDVAAVDGMGRVTGKKTGFSTLTVSSGGVIATAALNVVSVREGVPGWKITGVAADLSRRLYLAATEENTILLTQELERTPDLYAGTKGTAGYKNDERLKALFRRPEFIAYDQARGFLYVSDSANHVIRRIRPGQNGNVETLAGNGTAGAKDGPAAGATFNNPQGVALDNRGNLWIADAGNHTIRRLDLTTGIVGTVAGKAGSSGAADGPGQEARFNTPTGIAFETESLAQQLERELKGAPPTSLSLIVADTGNGWIRRVKETGEVDTIRGGNDAAAPENRSADGLAPTPLTFKSPSGVAVDAFRKIYVTEPGQGRVRIILETGEVVAATQAKTVSTPMGLAIGQSGSFVVADSSSAAREVKYGEPQITSIVPDKLSNRGSERVTITGKNFSSETLVIIGGVTIKGVQVRDTGSISFTTPPLASGVATLTVQARGGLTQRDIFVEPVALNQLVNGQITTVVGGSTFVGDGGEARGAALGPSAAVLDSIGNLFIADWINNRVRRVDAQTRIITTYAGTGTRALSGDNGPATAAQLDRPSGLTFDSAGNLFIADSSNHVLRKIDARTRIITTYAGTGTRGFSGDNGPASEARLAEPRDLAFDSVGNLFIADFGNHRIRRIDARTQIITTYGGTGSGGFSGDDSLATTAQLNAPAGIAFDATGDLFIADLSNNRVRRIDARTKLITTYAGGGASDSGDNGPATAAQLAAPAGLAFDSAGNLFIADSLHHRIRRVDAQTKIITTSAGNGTGGFSGDNGPAAAAQLSLPHGLAFDSAGNLFIADSGNDRTRRIDARTGIITTPAGTGTEGFAGDDALATAAELYYPDGIAFDSAGNLFIADSDDDRIRRVDARTRIITTYAGTGTSGFSGDNGPAAAAQLYEPAGIAFDSAGNLFFADSFNNRIRRIDARTLVVTTYAGTGVAGFSGDGGPAALAQLNGPHGIAFDSAGDLFLSDTYNHRVRTIDAQTRLVTTYAGTGKEGYSGDNVSATAAQLFNPAGIAFDSAGNLFIADLTNRRVRKVDARTKSISTYAGNGSGGDSGDGGPATAAALAPAGVVFDAAGNLFISDAYNNRVRRVDARTLIITTYVGTGGDGFFGDNGPASAAQLYLPTGMAFDSAGNFFVTDTLNHRIRAVRATNPAP